MSYGSVDCDERIGSSLLELEVDVRASTTKLGEAARFREVLPPELPPVSGSSTVSPWDAKMGNFVSTGHSNCQIYFHSPSSGIVSNVGGGQRCKSRAGALKSVASPCPSLGLNTAHPQLDPDPHPRILVDLTL